MKWAKAHMSRIKEKQKPEDTMYENGLKET